MIATGYFNASGHEHAQFVFLTTTSLARAILPEGKCPTQTHPDGRYAQIEVRSGISIEFEATPFV